MTKTNSEKLEKLKQLLQELTPKRFEELIASLFSEFLQVPIYIAKSGFQFGADLGTAGNQTRNLRIECKKYRDTTLNDRELRGEIDDSLLMNNSLEAWILASTQELALQSADKLHKKSEDVGVPIIIIDWKTPGFPALAALCCTSPAIIEEYLSKTCRVLVEDLIADSHAALAQLTNELNSWSVGFNYLSKISHKKLDILWNSAREANAYFGQNIAGGEAKTIDRKTISSNLTAWYESETDEPVALLGNEGVGKTWAAVNWILSYSSELPITLLIPSSNSFRDKPINTFSIIELIADRLHELTKSQRSREHWQKRVELLLNRPVCEGPIFLILIDGLNQESSIDWTTLFKILQGELFAGRIRVIFTCRTLFYKNKLHEFRSLIFRPSSILVSDYDVSKNGELDRKLALEGFKREDFHTDLLDLAKNPRLFHLVLKLKENLSGSVAITVHRLLWEYGKDSLGTRNVESFSESEWQAWLKSMASSFLSGVNDFSLKEIGESTQRPDLGTREVQARISDIIDGNFVEENPETGNHQFIPRMVSHALGLALLTELSSIDTDRFEDYEAKLNSWLDPISGLDERSELLRAAVAILLIKNSDTNNRLAGALVSAWLNSQNLPPSHAQELIIIAAGLVEPLLDTLEFSVDYAQDSARSLAVEAIKGIDKSLVQVYDSILERACNWLKEISLPFPFPEHQLRDLEDHYRNRIKNTLGKVEFGNWKILGKQFTLTRRADYSAADYIPNLLEGYPLAKAIPIFEMASIAQCIKDSKNLWTNLQWLSLLNEIDPEETIENLRKSSSIIRLREPEIGINRNLSSRAAAYMLWLSPLESDEIKAAEINNNSNGILTYENDYLLNPGTSVFSLERRHAKQVMRDPEILLRVKLQKVSKFLLDPEFEIPEEFKNEIIEASKSIDVSKLDSNINFTIEDHEFELMEVALARCSPKTLAKLMLKKLNQTKGLAGDSRFRRSIESNKHFILAGEKEARSAEILRLSAKDQDDKREWLISSHFFMLELYERSALAQAKTLLEADIENVWIDVRSVLKSISLEEAEVLVASYGQSNPEKIAILLFLIIDTPVYKSQTLWTWLTDLAQSENLVIRELSFRNLAIASKEKFGKHLLDIKWGWNAEYSEWENHYGSLALIEATQCEPIENVCHLIAPWLLLRSINKRGNIPFEIDTALSIINKIVLVDNQNLPDLGISVTIDLTQSEPYLQSRNIKPIKDDIKDFLFEDIETRRERYQESLDIAKKRIDETRKNGASFYLFSFGARDLDPLVNHSPESVQLWIEGLESLSIEFRKRVNLSSSFYVSLCETLLELNPELGTKLWVGLKEVLHAVHFTGSAGVDVLLNMLFKCSYSETVGKLREAILAPQYSRTDEDLFSVVLAATLNNKSAWVDEMISKDKSSALAWKNKRAIVLEGFKSNNTLPVQNAWPDKALLTSYQVLLHKSAFRQNIEACSHFWWNAYLNSTDSVSGYANWVLFSKTADRRVWNWLSTEQSNLAETPFEKRKALHVILNLKQLKNDIKKHEQRIDKKYLGLDFPEDFGHWSVSKN